ncbi:MAG TPA: hypothetical protein EYP40_07570 [Chromatiales bacterium]|nr:hypothetical protein [Chromatiales bacterium]
MITFDELNTQNHEIAELSKVLSYLLANREMCDTHTCCDPFYQYVDTIKSHLDKVDHTYTKLISSNDKQANHMASKFMGGSQEIKRILNQYTKKWCEKRKHELHIANHDDFYKETTELFDLVLKRIQDETEQLYPLIRKVGGDARVAA